MFDSWMPDVGQSETPLIELGGEPYLVCSHDAAFNARKRNNEKLQR